MISLILGVLTISLGAKAFTPKGLPLTSSKRLTGAAAKVVGIVCIVLGVGFLIDGLFGVAFMLRSIGR